MSPQSHDIGKLNSLDIILQIMLVRNILPHCCQKLNLCMFLLFTSCNVESPQGGQVCAVGVAHTSHFHRSLGCRSFYDPLREHSLFL